MEKEVRDGTIVSVALIVGVVAIFVFREIIEGLILLIFSGLIVWFSPGLREILLSFFKLVIGKFANHDRQNMNDSNKSVQVKAGRDATVNNIIKEGDTVIYQKSEDRKSRNEIIRDATMRDIYKKMTRALREVNRIGNVGVKDKDEYTKVNKIVEEFISAKMENEIDINEDIKSKLDEVMGAFRHTMHEIYILATNKNLVKV